MIARFIQEHLNDDTARLILDRAKWPEIDIDLAVNCIESRRKLKGKVQEWYDNHDLIFPLKLSAEQCSSSATAAYKAAMALSIFKLSQTDSVTDGDKMRIADLTGGYGVDSWSFSKVADQVLYCERLSVLCDAAHHNFAALGATNILVNNITISPSYTETVHHPEPSAPSEVEETSKGSYLLSTFHPDIIYMDPARRAETGKKVFLIEECTPDVLTLKDELFSYSRHILLKLSPMADISMVCERLGQCCREVHVVAMGGECKELLIWMDREWTEDYSIIAVELPHSPDHLYKDAESALVPKDSLLRFSSSEERNSSASIATEEDIAQAKFIFEPGKALMKAGAFNTLCQRFGLKKLGRFTHYYIIGKEDPVSSLGKIYEIISHGPLDKRSIKAAGAAYPKSEVTARNIPMDTDTLRKKLGITSGDDAHIFGLKSDAAGNLLFITRRA